jgi:TetR/AcrR family transcriptional regulator, tetracycline repressor protein
MIITAAIDLADRHGPDAVTIRRVASALDVTPMALYWHFRKKDDLLAGMVDWVFRQMDISTAEGAGWDEVLRSVLEAELTVLRRHPALASLMLSHESTSESLLNVIEVALAALRRAGFTPTEAVQVVQHAHQSVVNLVLRQPGHAPERTSREIEDEERQAVAMIHALPPDRYPHVIEAAVPLSRCEDPDAYFAFGLEMLMAGIRAIAARRVTGGS